MIVACSVVKTRGFVVGFSGFVVFPISLDVVLRNVTGGCVPTT